MTSALTRAAHPAGQLAARPAQAERCARVQYGISDGSSDIRWQQPPQGLQPAGDIQSVDDYRSRHALYRTDAGLQALSKNAALISIWCARPWLGCPLHPACMGSRLGSTTCHLCASVPEGPAHAGTTTSS